MEFGSFSWPGVSELCISWLTTSDIFSLLKKPNWSVSAFSILIWSATQVSPHFSRIFAKQNLTIASELTWKVSEICFARVSFTTIFLRANAFKMKKVFRNRQWPHVTLFFMSSRIEHNLNKFKPYFLKHSFGLHKNSQVSSWITDKFNAWCSVLVSTCWWSFASALYKSCLRTVKIKFYHLKMSAFLRLGHDFQANL